MKVVEVEKVLVILGVFEGVVKYMGGFKIVVKMIEGFVEDLKIIVFVVIYFDYGLSFDFCKVVIDVGFFFVMIDGFYYLIDENIVMIK